MSEKWLHVAMPDGSVWGVPARFIAEHRAAFIAERDTGAVEGPEFDLIYRDEIQYALVSRLGLEIIFWAENEMDWDGVKHLAKCVTPALPTNFIDGWINGDKRVVEEDKPNG